MRGYGKKPDRSRIDLKILKRKWRWLGHALRKAGTTIEKKALE